MDHETGSPRSNGMEHLVDGSVLSAQRAQAACRLQQDVEQRLYNLKRIVDEMRDDGPSSVIFKCYLSEIDSYVFALGVMLRDARTSLDEGYPRC